MELLFEGGSPNSWTNQANKYINTVISDAAKNWER